MSGHSKWANIKRRKEAQDKIRGNLFSKLSRIITLAVVEGGGVTDPEFNVRLRLAIEKAKKANMPKDKIEKAIERGVGPEKNQLKEVFYEAFAPKNVSLIIWATTDNPNRTLTEIRMILEKHGGKLASYGATSYLFEKCGLAVVKKGDLNEDEALKLADRLLTFDIETKEDVYIFYIPFEMVGKIKEIASDINFEEIDLFFKPKSEIFLDEDERKKIESLINELESLEDVHKVFSNASL